MCENVNSQLQHKKKNIITYSGGCKKSWLVLLSVDESLLFILFNSFKEISNQN